MLDQATKSCGISLSYRTPSFPASRPNGHGTLHLAKNAPLTGIRRCHPEMYAANRRIWVFAPSHWEYPAFHPCISVLLSVPPCVIGGKVFRRSILRKTSQASATAYTQSAYSRNRSTPSTNSPAQHTVRINNTPAHLQRVRLLLYPSPSPVFFLCVLCGETLFVRSGKFRTSVSSAFCW